MAASAVDVRLAIAAGSGFCCSRMALISEMVRGGATRLAEASFASAAASALGCGADILSAENSAALGRAAIMAVLTQAWTRDLALPKQASCVPPACLQAI